MVVPSLCRVSFQPHRWIAVRWWKPHNGTRLGRLVGPPRDLGTMWWMSHTLAGSSQPGKAQCEWRVVTARRRCAGMVSLAVPTSRGRLTAVSGRPSRAARNRAASPSGPDRASVARPSSASRSRPAPPGPPCLVVWRPMPWASRNASVNRSRAAQSTCPVTTGTTVASHSAASASGPVSQPGWEARAAAQASSAAVAPGVPRNCASVRCTSTCVGCPARAGTIPARISRRHASSRAS